MAAAALARRQPSQPPSPLTGPAGYAIKTSIGPPEAGGKDLGDNPKNPVLKLHTLLPWHPFRRDI